MSAIAIMKPELCYMNTVASLRNNPSSPMSVMKGTQFLDTIIQSRFMAPWQRMEDNMASQLAGKAKPSLPSVNPGINMARKYYMYDKPYCETDTDATCAPNICTVASLTDEQVGYLATDIDQCISETWSVRKDQFDNLNETPSERRAEMIRRKAWNIKQKVNKAMIAQLYASVSDYSDENPSIGLTTKHLNIISAGTSRVDVNPVAMAKIAKEYRSEGFNGDYVIFGGESLADYFLVREWRMSDEGRVGADAKAANLPFIYDNSFDTVFQGLEGDLKSHGVTVPIGSFAIDFWNEYTGYKVENFDDFIKTTIEIDGLVYDYALRYDKCDSTWTEQLKLHYGYLSIPDALYCNGRALIKHWTFGCGDVDCDTIC